MDIRNIKTLSDLTVYFSKELGWDIDPDDFVDIEDITYDFSAEDIGLREEAFAKIDSLQQLPALVDGQKWGIFFVEFESNRFEVSALRKILSGLVPKRRNSEEHAVWNQQDLVFLCTWGENNNRTIGIAHFEDKEKGLPQIKMISCAPAMEDFTQINVFKDRLKKLSWPKDPSDTDGWRESWSDAFVSGYRQAIHDSATLTVKLAAEAQNIRDRILDILNVESSNGYVHLLYEKFKSTLIADMTEKQFADMYAQTVVYGLFSARCMDDTQEDFSAAEAVECIPNTNPFLKSLMQECLGAQNTSKLSFDELEIENVVDLLRNTRTDAIINDFNRQTGGGKEDPVIHFYEEFLTAYDKTQKVQRGVYYTPQPVVNFIVSAVNSIVKKDFGLIDGLASTGVKEIKVKRQSKRRVNGAYKIVDDIESVPAIQVLDPATGTGTFVRQIILQVFEDFKRKNRKLSAEEFRIAWNEYVPKYLLPRINAFELMMAPYAVAHMKLAMVLRDTGYDFGSDERLNVYLTNSLEEPGDSHLQISLWDDPLATESIYANVVKKNAGINVVIGNPPYSTESANKGYWIDQLMESYKKEPDGFTKLKEKNSKPLNDDYVKFIRYGQEIIDKSENGILAYINPHGFMDGPIYRGMRTSLMRSFDNLYILNLHGNSNRQEVSPDGGKDENVFDIKQGVCILIGVKKRKDNKATLANVYINDFWGTRESKYSLLNNSEFHNINWVKINPKEPMNMFLLEDTEIKERYEQGFSVKDLFIVNGTGVLTKRDKLCIHFNEKEALQAASDLLNENPKVVKEKYEIPADVRDWKYSWAKEDLRKKGIEEINVKGITYRPFDNRYVYYTGQSRGFLGWPVHAVMQHMINTDNIALVTARSNKKGDSTHFFVSDRLVEYKCGERTTNSSVFPLYLMSDTDFHPHVNFSKEIINSFESKTGLTFSEEVIKEDNKGNFGALDLFAYIYAILYSKTDRDEYKEFINRDFPIIPYPSKEMFWKLSSLGKKLIDLHLMKASIQNTKVQFVGDNTMVEKTSFTGEKVFINKNSYFEGVDSTAWEFTIGGYQPLQKWLKDRKKTVLSKTDLNSYMKIVDVIKETQLIMNKIDQTV